MIALLVLGIVAAERWAPVGVGAYEIDAASVTETRDATGPIRAARVRNADPKEPKVITEQTLQFRCASGAWRIARLRTFYEGGITFNDTGDTVEGWQPAAGPGLTRQVQAMACAPLPR